MSELDTSCSVQVSARVLDTDPPVIVKTKRLMAQAPPEKPVLSLAQGVVHWHPPPEATVAAAKIMAAAAADADGSGSSSSNNKGSAGAAVGSSSSSLHSSHGSMRAVYGAGGVHSYGPPDGLPALTAALREKVASKNGLHGYEVMVTNGANQAFVNIVLALVDVSDRVVLFRPYYFNHRMALQMTGGGDQVVYGPCHPDSLHPDLDWLQQELRGGASGLLPPPKMVVIVNPCNPTGVLLPQQELQRAAELCAEAGAWLVLDNTYEDFVYSSSSKHHCVCKHNVINVFSFSKAYGMMGWRVGYIAYPGQQLLEGAGAGSVRLGEQLMKIQDTVAICPNQLGQHIALAALQHGSSYLQANVAALQHNRQLIADALSPLGEQGHGWVGGEGAIYFWAKLPERFSGPSISGSISGSSANSDNHGRNAAAEHDPVVRSNGCDRTVVVNDAVGGCCSDKKAATVAAAAAAGTAADRAAAGHAAAPAAAAAAAAPLPGGDEDVVAWLIREHGVCVIPGSACGAPGYIRVAFANVTRQQCEEAAARLKRGLQQLVGLPSVLCAGS